MKDVRPYILTRAPTGLDMYNYFRCTGGSGHGRKGLGGTYRFTAAYLGCEDEEDMGRMSMDIFCKRKNIPFGIGFSMEEAIDNLQSELEKNPLK